MTRTSAAPGLALDEQLCFALYSASRALTAQYRRLLEPLGLTYPQYLVLLSLWEFGPSTVSQLGTRLQLDSGTLSPLLKRLEASGLVTRQRREDDERSVEIRLTGRGKRLRERARSFPAQICASTGLPPETAADVVDTLHSIAANVLDTLHAAD